MRARVGDRLVVASRAIGGPVRDGEIVEVRTADGSPPYVVRWADTGHIGFVFPGVDAHLSSQSDLGPTPASLTAPAPDMAQPNEPPHVRSWRVDIDLYEAGDDTTAHAVLVAESPHRLDARGEAHREPADIAVPEIGDEVAVARALRRLADRLFETASSDLEGVKGPHSEVTT